MRAVAFALIALCAPGAARAQQPPRAASVDIRAAAEEFPPSDMQLYDLVRRGAAAAAVTDRLRQEPDNPEILEDLLQADRVDDALGVLRRIVDQRPERIAAAFEKVLRWSHAFRDEGRGYPAALQTIVADARAKIPQLPREDAARAERQLLSLTPPPSGPNVDRTERLRGFVKAYSGTEAALLTEVDIIEFGLPVRDQPAALDALAREHPGTVVAAKALHIKAFQLSTNYAIAGLEPRGGDPTDRLMAVLRTVAELESGRYPRCKWVDDAPSLVVNFFAADPHYAPENIDRSIDAYTTFAASHFKLAYPNVADNGIGYVVTTKVAALAEKKGNRAAEMERVFSSLESRVGDPAAVRLLKAQFYIKSMSRDRPASERPELLQKASSALEALSRDGAGVYRRNAHATLASLLFNDREYSKAREQFRAYVAAYPQSAWAWVAALRIGQCDEALGESQAAATDYAAARTYSNVPPATVLSHVYTGRAYEALGRFSEAAQELRLALDSWDANYGLLYSLYAPRADAAEACCVPSADSSEVRREALADRISELDATLAVEGGALLERAKWLAARGRWSESGSTARQFIEEYPRSPAKSQARYVADRAQLGAALDVAAECAKTAAWEPALKALKRVGEGGDGNFAVWAATVARATILALDGSATDAGTLMSDALERWRRGSAGNGAVGPAGTLGEDVRAIRDAVFSAAAGGILNGPGWNAFSWSERRDYAIVNPRVRVKLANGDVVPVSVRTPIAGLGKILFADSEQIGLLESILTTIGGTARRAPAAIMETPNQPIGPVVQITKFWNKYFWAQPGHWGGWVLETYPIITEVEFTNAGRTAAAVRVTVGYSGGTVLLEKTGGGWRAVRLTSQWIT